MRVAVLGGGLQGACVALELSSAGIRVDLYDRSDRCVSQASAQNEGKIHLGYLYANDRTLETARLMIRGAIRFSPLMRRWIGSDIDRVPVSRPFHYAVHRESLLGADEVESHLRASNAIAREMSNGNANDYFGFDYREAPVRLADYGNLFDPDRIVTAFVTPEVAIDAAVLAGFVRDRLSSESRINCIVNANVLDVAIADSRVDVNFEIAGERGRDSYDQVVNALWDGRLAIDATAGIRPERPWLFRIKHYLRVGGAAAAPALPSTTVVLGPFGDVVGYADGSLHLSWYPAGMLHASRELQPTGWPHVLDRETAGRLRRSIVSGLAGIIPMLADLDDARRDTSAVEGGVIFAWGATGIDDPASELHARSNVGTRSYGRYHSINTGKLTLVPLFAKMTADQIRDA
jgi:hypothetical protein